MIIRAKTFESWLRANLDRDQIRDLATHGADAGWTGLTYYSDTVKLYERFKDEIWEALYEDANDYSDHPGNIPAFIAEFRIADSIVDHHTFANALTWYMAERTARRLID